MYQYRCYGCGGMCDAGELENGVCYDCRQAYESEEQNDRENRTVVTEYGSALDM